jgi:putative phage-type endonuclease
MQSIPEIASALMTTALQQGTLEWHAARIGKLTASNVGAALGLCSWTSRKVAYERAIGTDTFEGNDATRWGTANEPNALATYCAHTGNLVKPTGLHVHKHADWLAGSPDGLIGTEGIVEAKCPYWSKTPHQTIPLYYYLQINLCLECADREWCDFISWTPGAHKVIRVTRDRDLHGVLASTHYAQFYRAMCDGDGPPKFAKGEKEMIREMVEESRNAHMDTGFWDRVDTRALPPTADDFPDLE